MADSGGKINLILGSYAHIPHGAPDQEFENIYNSLLKPFISNLYKYPHIQVALHYSGVLLYWIERSHPELFMLIEDMVSRRQAEMLGGGFYEPMLPLISGQDKIGQIELFTTYLRKQFGKRPMGCWIPALAWEQNLVGPLSACGMGYTFLSDELFFKVGLKQHELYWPYLTEDQGKIVTVFPIFHSLEKELAEKNVQAVFKKLYDRLPEGTGRTVSIFPRAIFSLPNEAADYAWNRFFEELTLSESIVESASPLKIIKGQQGKPKKACFPDSIGGGGLLPRNFLINYPEAGGIYSKMIFTNLLINQLRGDKARKLNAREELWKAQGFALFSSPDALYRHCLRKTAYRSLVGAERITREKTKFVPSLLQLDFDFDGINEYLFQDIKINCYIHTLGAGVFELDYLPRAWNYLDTCNFYGLSSQNQSNAASSQAGKIPGRRAAFVDNFYPAGADYQKLADNAIPALRCCAADYYSVHEHHEKQKGKAAFFLPPVRTTEDVTPNKSGGGASAAGGISPAKSVPLGEIGIEKTFSLKKDTLTLAYSLCNHGDAGVSFLFAPDIDLSFPGEGEGFIRIFKCKTGAKDTAAGPVIHDAEYIKIQDIKNEVQIILSSTNSFDACIRHRRIPVNGTELYQSTAMIPLFAVHLESGQTWANELSLKFSN